MPVTEYLSSCITDVSSGNLCNDESTLHAERWGDDKDLKLKGGASRKTRWAPMSDTVELSERPQEKYMLYIPIPSLRGAWLLNNTEGYSLHLSNLFVDVFDNDSLGVLGVLELLPLAFEFVNFNGPKFAGWDLHLETLAGISKKDQK